MAPPGSDVIYEFGRFALDVRERRLSADGADATVAPRAFNLLVVLLERAGRLVSKDEIMSRVWPKLVVEESNLQVHVSALRKLIGADAIETVKGSGYRFKLAVSVREPATAHSAPMHQHNLPRPLTRFVAGERQVEACARLLERTRLLTVTGAAGLGKTRLCQEVAHACLDRFEHGVWMVELAPVADPRRLPEVVAAALGLDVAGSGTPALLKDYVASRRILLVLDNCEHLIEGCSSLVWELLQASVDLTVLASSREALRASGEVVFSISPLRVPDRGATLPPLDVLASYDGVRLFLDRAAAARPGFALTPRTAAAVGQICAGLDGIPLALELAAARVRVMSVESIAHRLEDRFALLRADDATAAPRHRTLQAALDWSYDLLSPDEQQLLGRLSVFAAGWTLEAAESVGTGDVLDLIFQLVEKSLVVFESSADRYHMLETIRQYAQTRMDERANEEARRAHASCYLALARIEGPKLFGCDEEAANATLDRESGNIRAACGWYHAHGDHEAVVDLCFALRRWFCRFDFGQLRPLLADALASLAERPSAACRGLFAMGFLSYFNGRYDDSLAYSEQSLRVARELRDDVRAADALQMMGMAAPGVGKVDEARGYLEEAVTLATRACHDEILADALMNLGEVVALAGEGTRARAHYERALALSRAAGSRDFSTIILGNLSRVAIGERRPAEARGFLAQALATAGEARWARKAYSLMHMCAGLAAVCGDDARSARFFGLTARLMREKGQPVEPVDEAVLGPLRASVRNRIGESAYQALALDGAAMPLDQVFSETRGWLDGLAATTAERLEIR